MKNRDESKWHACDVIKHCLYLFEYILRPLCNMHGWTVGSLNAVQACYCPRF